MDNPSTTPIQTGPTAGEQFIPQDPGQYERTVTGEEFLGQLDGVVKPVRKTPVYYLGLSVVAVAMILLPLIYLALIAAVGYALFLHATEGSVILSAGGGGMRLRLLAYFGPLVVGGTVLFFMFKPLFASPPKGPEPFTLDPDEQPLLRAYVEKLSRLLGAPRPRVIDLDCNVNASASLRRVPGSLFQSDLVLTIGLPLVEGMSLRQLTGVLAHELGHFAQGGGMRLSNIIRRINFWFARVVYERDRFDVSLQETCEENRVFVVLAVAWTARGCVWLTRRVLWVLMQAGNVISCVLLRQMEFDADRYETRVAGSDSFEKTAYRLLILGIGSTLGQRLLDQYWREHKLPDHYPRLTILNAGMIDEKSRQVEWTRRLAEKTRWLDTHPSDADRIKNAVKEAEPGLIRIEQPATALFDNYLELSAEITNDFYATVLGEHFERAKLVSTDELLAATAIRTRNAEVLNRFFHGRVNVETAGSLAVGRIADNTDINGLRSTIEESRKKVMENPLETTSDEQKVLRDRLDRSLQLVKTPEVRAAMEEGGGELIVEKIESRVQFLHQLESQFLTVKKLRLDFESLMNRLSHFNESKHEEQYQLELRQKLKQCCAGIKKLNESLAAYAYPYDHAEEGCDCSRYAIPAVPEPEDVDGVIDVCQHCLNQLYTLYFRVLGELAFVAERAETLAGFPILDEPSVEDTQ